MGLLLNELDFPFRIKTADTMSDTEFERFCAANEATRFERDGNGEIIVMSPNFSDGGGTELDVAAEFRSWALADGRGRTFGPSAGFTLPDGSVRAADVSWVRWNIWNAFSEDERSGSFVRTCPEFVIEVRSKSDRLNLLREKMGLWIANGAEVAWLVDPLRKAVEFYRAGEETEMFENPSSVLGTGCVAGFELVLERVWGR